MQGMFELQGSLDAGRTGALRDVPTAVRTRIRSEINSRLAGAGVTRSQVRQVVGELERVRVMGRSTLNRLAQYL